MENQEIQQLLKDSLKQISNNSYIELLEKYILFERTNDLDYRRGVANAVEDFCNAATTPDAQEGLRAFIEKRQPIWGQTI